MFPEHVTVVLQQLSYLALIIIAPCTIYNTVTNLITREQLKTHILLDDLRFTDIKEAQGKHSSKIHDLEMNRVSTSAEVFSALLQQKGG